MEQSIFKAVARLLPLRNFLSNREERFSVRGTKRVCVWGGGGGHLEKSGLRFTDAFFFFFL